MWCLVGSGAHAWVITCMGTTVLNHVLMRVSPMQDVDAAMGGCNAHASQHCTSHQQLNVPSAGIPAPSQHCSAALTPLLSPDGLTHQTERSTQHGCAPSPDLDIKVDQELDPRLMDCAAIASPGSKSRSETTDIPSDEDLVPGKGSSQGASPFSPAAAPIPLPETSVQPEPHTAAGDAATDLVHPGLQAGPGPWQHQGQGQAQGQRYPQSCWRPRPVPRLINSVTSRILMSLLPTSLSAPCYADVALECEGVLLPRRYKAAFRRDKLHRHHLHLAGVPMVDLPFQPTTTSYTGAYRTAEGLVVLVLSWQGIRGTLRSASTVAATNKTTHTSTIPLPSVAVGSGEGGLPPDTKRLVSESGPQGASYKPAPGPGSGAPCSAIAAAKTSGACPYGTNSDDAGAGAGATSGAIGTSAWDLPGALVGGAAGVPACRQHQGRLQLSYASLSLVCAADVATHWGRLAHFPIDITLFVELNRTQLPTSFPCRVVAVTEPLGNTKHFIRGVPWAELGLPLNHGLMLVHRSLRQLPEPGCFLLKLYVSLPQQQGHGMSSPQLGAVSQHCDVASQPDVPGSDIAGCSLTPVGGDSPAGGAAPQQQQVGVPGGRKRGACHKSDNGVTKAYKRHRSQQSQQQQERQSLMEGLNCQDAVGNGDSTAGVLGTAAATGCLGVGAPVAGPKLPATDTGNGLPLGCPCPCPCPSSSTAKCSLDGQVCEHGAVSEECSDNGSFDSCFPQAQTQTQGSQELGSSYGFSSRYDGEGGSSCDDGSDVNSHFVCGRRLPSGCVLVAASNQQLATKLAQGASKQGMASRHGFRAATAASKLPGSGVRPTRGRLVSGRPAAPLGLGQGLRLRLRLGRVNHPAAGHPTGGARGASEVGVGAVLGSGTDRLGAAAVARAGTPGGLPLPASSNRALGGAGARPATGRVGGLSQGGLLSSLSWVRK